LLCLRRRQNKRHERGEKYERPKHTPPSEFIVAPEAVGKCAILSATQTL
jgi:hypothetical protein